MPLDDEHAVRVEFFSPLSGVNFKTAEDWRDSGFRILIVFLRWSFLSRVAPTPRQLGSTGTGMSLTDHWDSDDINFDVGNDGFIVDFNAYLFLSNVKTADLVYYFAARDGAENT